jgi:hypothetical protein
MHELENMPQFSGTDVELYLNDFILAPKHMPQFSETDTET